MAVFRLYHCERKLYVPWHILTRRASEVAHCFAELSSPSCGQETASAACCHFAHGIVVRRGQAILVV